MGSGTILREVIEAARLLKEDFDVAADIWSMTSINELAREAKACQRWNRLHPTKKAKKSFLENQLEDRKGPAIIATDYIQAYPDQIRDFVPMRYVCLGTDGYGRSDTRAALRDFFEVNRHHIVVAALKALVDEGAAEANVVTKAIKLYGIDAERPDPMSV